MGGGHVRTKNQSNNIKQTEKSKSLFPTSYKANRSTTGNEKDNIICGDNATI